MKKMQPKNRVTSLRRRIVVLIAALSLCLNSVLPIEAMAAAIDTGERAVICTSDGYKTIHQIEDGAPRPSQDRHESADCPCCFGCDVQIAQMAAAHAATLPNTQNTILPEAATRHHSADRRGNYPRGPPHLA